MSDKPTESKIIGHEIEEFKRSLAVYMNIEYQLMQSIENLAKYVTRREIDRIIYEAEQIYGYQQYSRINNHWRTYKHLRNVGIPFEHIVQVPLKTWNRIVSRTHKKIRLDNYMQIITDYHKTRKLPKRS